MLDAGFARVSEFTWDYHYGVYWDLTQRLYREELDPTYGGQLQAGIPFCQSGYRAATPTTTTPSARLRGGP